MSKYDLMIINRSFWPIYPVIGEALLNLAEKISKDKRVCVVLQDHANIKKKLLDSKRGANVSFFPVWAGTNSSSNILLRFFDNFFFMLWVLGCIVYCRPNKIYVSTDPPILVPFIVSMFSKIFNIDFFYHLQDIHPEATNAVYPMNKNILNFFIWLDSYTMKNAKKLITLNEEMKNEIINRSNTKSKIYILNNPSVHFKKISNSVKKKGFSFSGNAGRFQRIPLLIESIKEYHFQGGKMKFIFAGGGIYSNKLKKLAEKNKLVKYLGIISAEEAANLSQNYEWALLPIEDKVTSFAFPSKASSYVVSNAKILAICGYDTSISKWVKKYNLGITSLPTNKSLIDIFHKIENGWNGNTKIDMNRIKLKRELDPYLFVQKLENIIFT